MAREDYIEPLDDLVNTIGKGHFTEASLKLEYMYGHYWFIPMKTLNYFIFEKIGLMKKVGYTKDIDDVLKAAATLTENTDGDGKIDMESLCLLGDVNKPRSGSCN